MNTPSIPSDKDTPAEAVEEVVALLREAGEERREFGRELMRPLTVPLPDLLREGGRHDDGTDYRHRRHPDRRSDHR